MHRVKRPAPEAKNFGFSRVHYHTGHDLPGEEPKAKTVKRKKSETDFQLDTMGGPLEEEFGDRI